VSDWRAAFGPVPGKPKHLIYTEERLADGLETYYDWPDEFKTYR
jgi:hypothetical protein